jgi:Flp pilus assembly protein TadD
MSLLMDALKRAEKARQAQAEKQAPEEGASGPEVALELEPVRGGAPGFAGQPRSAQGEQGADARPPSPAPGVATTDFWPSDNFPPTERMPLSKPAAETGEAEKLGPFSLVRDDELSLEDTAEMLPVVREAERSLNEYFEDGDSGAAVADEVTNPAGDEETTLLSGRALRDGESGSKRAAQSVFKAKAPVTERRGRLRALVIALPLLLVAAIGVGVVLLWDQLERTFFGAPPVLVQRTPQATELAPPPGATAASAASASSSVPEAATASRPAAEERSGAEIAASTGTPPEATAASAGETAESNLAGAPITPPEAIAVAPAAAGFQGVSARQSTAAAPKPRPVDASPAVASFGRPYAAAAGGIQISRRSDVDQVHAGINEAYLAYQRGDDAAARALYSEVIRHHPSNRNALLGLGAIAVRGGNYEEAVAHYAHLLSVDPRDPIARAALINLNQRVPANEGEGHVKRLLAEDSEQPFLYFTLGNLYARQGRWLEAQQAYFDAYRLDDGSADFAFNLAVSLDRLGKSASALGYYHRALELGANGAASFEPRAAQLRIDRLRGGGQR